VGGESITVGELVDMAKRGVAAEEYSSYASTLMRPDASESDREQAVRFLMTQEGYNPEQIENYVSALQGREEAQSAQDHQEARQDDKFAQYQRYTEDRMNRLEQKQSQVGVDFLRTRMREAVQNTMDNSDVVKTLIRKSEELNGPEGAEDRKVSIQAQLETQLVENLRARKSKGENFEVSWFNEEVNRAADTIYNRIRSVIGDPDKIGRSPETVAGAEMLFSNRQPVEEPKYTSGDNIGTLDSKARDWNTDTLSRLAMDLSSGGETKT
jgi:hypothetical protein